MWPTSAHAHWHITQDSSKTCRIYAPRVCTLVLFIYFIIIISHASIGADIKKRKEKKINKKINKSRADQWLTGLFPFANRGLTGSWTSHWTARRVRWRKRDCTNRVITNRIKLTQYFHMVILNHKVISIA